LINRFGHAGWYEVEEKKSPIFSLPLHTNQRVQSDYEILNIKPVISLFVVTQFIAFGGRQQTQ